MLGRKGRNQQIMLGYYQVDKQVLEKDHYSLEFGAEFGYLYYLESRCYCLNQPKSYQQNYKRLGWGNRWVQRKVQKWNYFHCCFGWYCLLEMMFGSLMDLNSNLRNRYSFVQAQYYLNCLWGQDLKQSLQSWQSWQSSDSVWELVLVPELELELEQSQSQGQLLAFMELGEQDLELVWEAEEEEVEVLLLNKFQDSYVFGVQKHSCQPLRAAWRQKEGKQTFLFQVQSQQIKYTIIEKWLQTTSSLRVNYHLLLFFFLQPPQVYSIDYLRDVFNSLFLYCFTFLCHRLLGYFDLLLLIHSAQSALNVQFAQTPSYFLFGISQNSKSRVLLLITHLAKTFSVLSDILDAC